MPPTVWVAGCGGGGGDGDGEDPPPPPHAASASKAHEISEGLARIADAPFILPFRSVRPLGFGVATQLELG